MEWFILTAPVPGPIELSIGTSGAFLVTLVAALAPVALAVRDAFNRGRTLAEAPSLRVIEGGKEPSRRAA